jgi:hypothetical protein
VHYDRFPVWKSKTTEELANCLCCDVCSAALCSDSAHGLDNTCCCSKKTKILEYLITTGGLHQTRTLTYKFFDANKKLLYVVDDIAIIGGCKKYNDFRHSEGK